MASPYQQAMPPALTRTEDKYNNDPTFRTVVDTLQMVIEQLQLTPGEVREAAVYACMRVEMRRAGNYLVPLEPEFAKEALRVHGFDERPSQFTSEGQEKKA